MRLCRFDDRAGLSTVEIIDSPRPQPAASAALSFPSWWSDPAQAGRVGVPPVRGRTVDHVARSLFDAGATAVECLAAASLCTEGLAAAMSWLRGVEAVDAVPAVPLPVAVDSDAGIRSELEVMGFEREHINQILRDNVSRDVGVLLEALLSTPLETSSTAAASIPVAPGEERVPDDFAVEDTPQEFLEQVCVSWLWFCDCMAACRSSFVLTLAVAIQLWQFLEIVLANGFAYRYLLFWHYRIDLMYSFAHLHSTQGLISVVDAFTFLNCAGFGCSPVSTPRC
jgi:hypothetical protein